MTSELVSVMNCRNTKLNWHRPPTPNPQPPTPDHVVSEKISLVHSWGRKLNKFVLRRIGLLIRNWINIRFRRETASTGSCLWLVPYRPTSSPYRCWQVNTIKSFIYSNKQTSLCSSHVIMETIHYYVQPIKHVIWSTVKVLENLLNLLLWVLWLQNLFIYIHDLV